MTNLWEVAILHIGNGGYGMQCNVFSTKEAAERFLAEAQKLWTRVSLTELTLDGMSEYRCMTRHGVTYDKVTGEYSEWTNQVLAPPGIETGISLDDPHHRVAVSYISHADARALLEGMMESGAGSAVDGEVAAADQGGNP